MKETWEERTFDEGLGVAMTELTNQVVEPTGKTRLTASLLLGVWMETLERSLRRRGHKERRQGHKERKNNERQTEIHQNFISLCVCVCVCACVLPPDLQYLSSSSSSSAPRSARTHISPPADSAYTHTHTHTHTLRSAHSGCSSRVFAVCSAVSPGQSGSSSSDAAVRLQQQVLG